MAIISQLLTWQPHIECQSCFGSGISRFFWPFTACKWAVACRGRWPDPCWSLEPAHVWPGQSWRIPIWLNWCRSWANGIWFHPSWLVVSNIFLLSIIYGIILPSDQYFSEGWNHQPARVYVFFEAQHGASLNSANALITKRTLGNSHAMRLCYFAGSMLRNILNLYFSCVKT